MLLGQAGGSLVDQQIAHRHVGIAEIGPEQRFAKEIHKLAAGRMAAEKLSALVARTVKGAVALLDVVNEGAEKGRTQPTLIFQRGGFKLTAIIFTVGVTVLKDTVDVGQVGCGNTFCLVGHHENGNVKPGLFDFLHHPFMDIINREHGGGNINKVTVVQIDNITAGRNKVVAGPAGRYFQALHSTSLF